jgi:hypothetical protein
MSYGERENDDFLVHYGFVPDGNPHDSVVLFAEGVEEGVEWFIHKMRKSWKDLDRAALKVGPKHYFHRRFASQRTEPTQTHPWVCNFLQDVAENVGFS